MAIEAENEWYHVIDQVLTDRVAELGVSMPGNVVSYDRASQTARVRPALTKRLTSYTDPEDVFFEDRPDLYNVPVLWPGGDAGGTGSSYFHPGLEAGEGVLILVSDADFAQWRKTGKKMNQRNEDFHSYAHCVCIPGLRPRPDKLPDNEVILAVGGITRSVAVADPLRVFLNSIITQFNALSASPTITGTQLAAIGAQLQIVLNANNIDSPYIKTGGL
jgi:hypothetical protein